MVQQHTVHSEKEIICLKDICRSFDGYTVLKNLSVSIRKNSVHALIGPNGAGKTTFLRVVANLLQHDSGNIDYKFDRHNISVMLENDYLFESKTGRQNMESYSQYWGIDLDTALKNISGFTKLLQMDGNLDKKVHKYSKGMKRKISMLIVLARNTELVIFDEPTSGIDPESRMEIRKLFDVLKDQGKTILLTSHDLSEVKKVSDYISFIKDGSILETVVNDDAIEDLEVRYFHKKEG